MRVRASDAHGIRRSGLLHQGCLTGVMHVLFWHHALIRHLLSVHVLSHAIVSLLLLRLGSLTVIGVLVSRWCLGFRPALLGTLGDVRSVYSVDFDVLGRESFSASFSIDLEVVGVLGDLPSPVVVIASVIDPD